MYLQKAKNNNDYYYLYNLFIIKINSISLCTKLFQSGFYLGRAALVIEPNVISRATGKRKADCIVYKSLKNWNEPVTPA